MATGDSFSSVELSIGNPDEGEAPELHLASGYVQDSFHHMGIPEWLRPYFCLRPLSARAFGMMGKNVQGVRVSAERKAVSCATHVAHGVSGTCSFPSMSASSRRTCADLPLSLPVITDGGPHNRYWAELCGFSVEPQFWWSVFADQVLSGPSLRARGNSRCSFRRDARDEDHPFSRCSRTYRQAYFSSQVGVARFDASSSCLRKGRATDCWSSLTWRHCLARSAVPFGLDV